MMSLRRLELFLVGEEFFELSKHLDALLGVQAGLEKRLKLSSQAVADAGKDEVETIGGLASGAQLLLQRIILLAHANQLRPQRVVASVRADVCRAAVVGDCPVGWRSLSCRRGD